MEDRNNRKITLIISLVAVLLVIFVIFTIGYFRNKNVSQPVRQESEIR